jgi:hypothetical protein
MSACLTHIYRETTASVTMLVEAFWQRISLLAVLVYDLHTSNQASPIIVEYAKISTHGSFSHARKRTHFLFHW